MSSMASDLLDELFGSGTVQSFFTDVRRLQSMLNFEAALARAEARLELVPAAAAEIIAAHCHADRFDLESLSVQARSSGNLAIPMVAQLTRKVRETSPQAAGFVHWGATSQDVIDTGCILQLRDALAWSEATLDRLCHELAGLAQTYRTTPMAGRTWLQQAVPVSFGLKAAGWLSALQRDRERLTEMRPRMLMLQFGGAAGTLASLGNRGHEVATVLAEELGLGLPALAWHGARDRMAEVATFHGLLCGTLGKVARDMALMIQTEVAELAEPAAAGRGGSSTMPHKRNPVAAAAVLAAVLQVPGLVSTMLSAMLQEHERGLGGWLAEWQTLPRLSMLSMGALEHLAELAAGLQVFPGAMRRNLEATQGLIFAEAVSMELAGTLGRDRAHALLQEASRQAAESGLHLREVITRDAELSSRLNASQLDRLFDATNYLGDAEGMIDRVLAEYKRHVPRQEEL